MLRTVEFSSEETRTDEPVITQLQVKLIQDDQEGFTVVVPELPGLITEGNTIEEAYENLLDAFNEYMQSFVDTGEPLPTDPKRVSFILLVANS